MTESFLYMEVMPSVFDMILFALISDQLHEKLTSSYLLTLKRKNKFSGKPFREDTIRILKHQKNNKLFYRSPIMDRSENRMNSLKSRGLKMWLLTNSIGINWGCVRYVNYLAPHLSR